MTDIATAARVGRATLYRYFPSRGALPRAMAETALDELCDRLADADLDVVPVAEGIARLTRAFAGTGSKYVAFLRSGHKPVDPAEIDQRLAEPLRALFRRGVEDGTLRSDLSVEVMLALYTGLLEAAIPLARQSGLGVERASSATTTVFLTGALNRPGNG